MAAALASIAGLGRVSDEVCAELRARVASAGFTAELVAEAESFFPGVLRPPRLPVLRWWLGRQGGAGALLARLFVYDDALTRGEAGEALGASLLEALLAAGLLAVTPEDGVVAAFLLTPIAGGLVLLSDSLDGAPDAVMGPGGGTEHLAALVPASFHGSALDLGCGAGTLALVAAKSGARRALGVDLNARAIDIARFNARLNALDAEFRVGDTVEPVGDERFDLVLSQPPFVVRPPDHAGATFLFGGPNGDELPLRFLGAIPGVLAPAGRALLLMQSAEREGSPLAPRLRRVLGAESVDLLVLGTRAPPPAVQASVFASFEDPSLGERYAELARSYLDAFAALEMRAFDGALVVVQRPDAARGGGHYTLGLTLGASRYDRAALESFLAGLALLECSSTTLERACLRLSPRARVTRELSNSDSAEPPRVVIRVEFPGIGSVWSLAADELAILAAVDGADSVGAAFDACAAGRRGSPSAVRKELTAFVRSALVRGALVLSSP